MTRKLSTITIIVLSLTIIFFTTIYGLSEWKLNDVIIPPQFKHPIKADSTTIKKGQNLARTRGCFGCHSQQLEGKVVTDQWGWVDVAVAPNLAKYAREHSPSNIETAVRHGIGYKGQSLWSMPSYNWVNLSDEDMASIIAFLQSAPIIEKELDKANLGFYARWNIAFGIEPHIADLASKVQPIKVDSLKTASYKRGQYIAMTTCNECHGSNLKGEAFENMFAPTPKIINTYTEKSFQILMKEGIAQDGRKNLGIMRIAARDRFAYFSDLELYDLYTFLNAQEKANTQ